MMIQLPALRERRDDIPRLVEHFLQKFSAIHRHVRQLENGIEQAVVLADGETIDVDVLSLDEHEPKKPASAAPAVPISLTLADVEQEHILRTLRAVDGSRTRAARLLGISLRCLQYKLKSYAEEGSEPIEPISGARTNYTLGV